MYIITFYIIYYITNIKEISAIFLKNLTISINLTIFIRFTKSPIQTDEIIQFSIKMLYREILQSMQGSVREILGLSKFAHIDEIANHRHLQ